MAMKQEIKNIIKDPKSNKYTIAQALYQAWGIEPKEAKKPYNDD